MDKHPQAIGLIFQNGIGAAAHDHAAFLCAQLQNHALLGDPQTVLIGERVKPGANIQCAGQTAAKGAIFTLIFNVFLGKSAFFGKAFDQFMVIAGNAQLFCNFTAHGAATAAKLTADRNDTVFHIKTPFRIRRSCPKNLSENFSLVLWLYYSAIYQKRKEIY